MREVIFSLLTLGLIGLFFSILLAFLSKKFSVKENEVFQKILDILPGINCGACGFSSCRAFAESVIKQNNTFSGCIPGGSSVNNKIKSILGISLSTKDKKVAICHCAAEEGEKKISSEYYGPLTCKAADVIESFLDCIYGCLGFGDCQDVCPVGAITINKRKVFININLCIGCGKCIEACPRGLFELVSLKELPLYYVACNNKDKGVEVRKVCSKGCIGCKICSSIENSPFIVKDNLSYIDRNKKAPLGVLEEASNKCPTRCILKNNA